MELRCAVQNYDWGKRGSKSIVAQLVQAADNDFLPDVYKSYAELWMGTHRNGPSCLKENATFLKDHIDRNKHILGKGIDGNIFEDLPFLFKVLSIGKPLSIQAHPDKKRAERLNLQQPEIYKDSNHKPELAIALSRFEAFCGFRPLNEIKRYMEIIPEFRAVVQPNNFENVSGYDREYLKMCFQRVLSQKPETIAGQLDSLIDRLAKLDEKEREILHANLLERLHGDFPGDVGCFGIYFFNYITLEAGEAIYIAANEPHAYLSGDCVECMACSDNVVRAGLTPKPKDLETLIEMLTYSCEPVSSKLFKGFQEDECTEIFRPPVPDFAIAKIIITADKKSYDLIPRSTASILLTMDGSAEIPSARSLKRGSVLFIPANEKISLQLICHPLIMFQAFANVTE